MKIIGTPLYQWEDGRQLQVTPLWNMRVDCVHIANVDATEALVVKPKEKDGILVVDIPNILLQSGSNIIAYSVNVSEDCVETLEECVFSVRARPKPADYVYTETEVLNYTYLDNRLDHLEGDGLANAVEAYLKENPVQAGATAEEAKQIAQNTADIEKLSMGKLDATELPNAINEALAQAKASGEFKGEPGEPGQPGKDGADGQPGADGEDYVLTEADKSEIAEMAAELVDVPKGSGGSGTLLPETEISQQGRVQGFGYKSVPVGEKVAVIIDGKPYITTHRADGEGLDRIYWIGNITVWIGGNGSEYDTGEPFFAQLFSDGAMFFFADGASHRVAICTVDALDEVYIRALNSIGNMPGGSGSFVVNVTIDEASTPTSADKTYEEINGALESGVSVVAVAGDLNFPYAGLSVDNGSILFALNGGTQGGAELILILSVTTENVWSMTIKDFITAENIGMKYVSSNTFNTFTKGVAKVQTASVGQTIKVKSVDDNGVPTAWEAVDFPSGGNVDYADVENKPKINGVELTGDKSLEDLGIGQPTDEQVGTAVGAWLDEHPEATTTIADGSVTPEKTSFITSPTEEAEDIVSQMVCNQNWGACPSEPMYVENVDFLFAVHGNAFHSCEFGEYTNSVWTKTGNVPKVSILGNQSDPEKVSIYVLGGYTGYIKWNYSIPIYHIYKNCLPPVTYPSMIDEDLYLQGLTATYVQKPYWYQGMLNSTTQSGYPTLLYKAESVDEKVKCYHIKSGESANTNISIYDENWNLIETIKGTKTYDLVVSGGTYYLYSPQDNGTARDESLSFLGSESDFELWTLNGNRYGWVYTMSDTQKRQLINDKDFEEFVVNLDNALTPKFTFVGELWGKNLGKYQAWSFNDLKWDDKKKRFIMLMHDAISHGDGNCTQCYLKEINPYTFEYTDLPRIQVNSANIASYGFEILDNGNYITLVSYDGGMRILTSTDGGQTYTAGEIIQDLTDNGMYKGTYHPFALMKLSNGRLFISCDTAQNELLYSDDSGATWKIATVPMGEITYTMTEPDLTELDNEGTVIMLARSSRAVDSKGTDLAEAIFSISYDYGTTWETAQLSEVRCNCSDATALVHDGIVEVFACNKYCPVGGALNRIQALVDATGYHGDIRRYYATIEEAKQNIWHYAGIMGFAQTKNPGYDMGSPCCCMTPNGDIWVGFYDEADDTTKVAVLYRWFVAHKNGSYNFAKGIQEIAMRLNS